MVWCAWGQLRDPITGKTTLTWGLLLRICHSTRLRKATVGLIFAYLAIYAGTYAYTTRRDLDIYAMPRVLSKLQAASLQSYLSQREPHAVAVKSDPLDPEASAYARQLWGALRAGGWNADFNGSAPDADPKIVSAGLCVETTGDNSGPSEPKHDPRPLLQDALRLSQIETNCGEGEGAGEYKLYLLVGHRPVEIGKQVPLLVRMADWLKRQALQ